MKKQPFKIILLFLAFQVIATAAFAQKLFNIETHGSDQPILASSVPYSTGDAVLNYYYGNYQSVEGPSANTQIVVDDTTKVTNSWGCMSLPTNYSKPAVRGANPPDSLWQGWTYPGTVSLNAMPDKAPVDVKMAIHVSGLPAGAPVTLKARMTDAKGMHWHASATFIANQQGEVDTRHMAPIYGNYTGTHAAGLIWSLTAHDPKYHNPVMFSPPDIFNIHILAFADSTKLAEDLVTRYWKAPNVTEKTITTKKLVGNLYMPSSPGPHPAIIVLGGSEGGLQPESHEAALLASHGYVALGLAYFQGPAVIYGSGDKPRLDGLPKQLVNIPLEYFHHAAQWLRKQPGVDPHHIAIMGWSKGAEAALTAAAHWPNAFQAVIAKMPQSVVWQGIQYNPKAEPASSWTFHGQPVPYASLNTKLANPTDLEKMYTVALNHLPDDSPAVIPVARINAPILLISATDDHISPSPRMAHTIMQRLNKHHHPYHDVSLCYAGAGHHIMPPYQPTTNAAIVSTPKGRTLNIFGGHSVAYSWADINSWHKILAFLQHALKSGSH